MTNDALNKTNLRRAQDLLDLIYDMLFEYKNEDVKVYLDQLERVVKSDEINSEELYQVRDKLEKMIEGS